MSSTTTAPATLETGHVGLNVTDLRRSVEFYRRVLGLEVVRENHDGERSYAFLGRSGKLLVTLWQQSAGSFDSATPGLHHLSFQVPSIDDVRAAESVLRELSAAFVHDGVVPHAEGADSGGVFFSDPDGIRLEIYATAGAAGGGTAPSGTAPTCGFF